MNGTAAADTTLAERPPDAEVEDWVRLASRGDRTAWSRLVDRLAPVAWAVWRNAGLDEERTIDAARVTWLRLADRLQHLAEVGGTHSWLVSTAKQEAIRAAVLHGSMAGQK